MLVGRIMSYDDFLLDNRKRGQVITTAGLIFEVTLHVFSIPFGSVQSLWEGCSN